MEFERLNTITHGDCIAGMRTIPDESVDIIVTDPPYLMNYVSRHRDKNHKYRTPIAGDNDPELIKTYIDECYRILKNNSACYMFCNSNKVDYFKQCLEEAGFNVKNLIVWVKNNHTAGDLVASYGKKYEFIFYVNKGRCPILGGRITDVWECDKVVGKKQLHQNQKPVELIERCIEKSSQPGAVVFDGFMGSGTTAIACLKTGRYYIGYELDDDYYSIAQERVENFKSEKTVE